MWHAEAQTDHNHFRKELHWVYHLARHGAMMRKFRPIINGGKTITIYINQSERKNLLFVESTTGRLQNMFRVRFDLCIVL